ncbi:MAG: CaiB/BaiF CoA-transferase family protein, partial [Acidimicrobiales bacterium]
PAGELVGKILGQMGAEVVKIEPLGGSPTRHVGPYKNGEPDIEHSLSFWFYNAGKHSAELDYDAVGFADRLADLTAQADVVVSTLPFQRCQELGVSYDTLLEHNPRLCIVSITPFGLSGPWRDWVSSDLVSMSLGGALHSCGYDDHSIPPIRPGGDQSFHSAASFALISLGIGLIEREASGLGQIFDLSIHDSVAVLPELANPFWFYPKAVIHRQTCRHAQPSPTSPTAFLCSDGRYVYFLLRNADNRQWRKCVELLTRYNLQVDLGEPVWDEFEYRRDNYWHIQEVLEVFFLLNDSNQIYREAQQMGLPMGRVNAPEDLLVDPHLLEREFFDTIEDLDGDPAVYPGPPYRVTGVEPRPTTRAPRLDEHNAEVLELTLRDPLIGSDA